MNNDKVSVKNVGYINPIKTEKLKCIYSEKIECSKINLHENEKQKYKYLTKNDTSIFSSLKSFFLDETKKINMTEFGTELSIQAMEQHLKTLKIDFISGDIHENFSSSHFPRLSAVYVITCQKYKDYILKRVLRVILDGLQHRL